MTIKKLLNVNIPVFFMGAAFVTILGSSIFMRISSPGLTVNTSPDAMYQGQTERKMDNSGEMSAIGVLMRQVAENPGDVKVITNLVENLLAAGQWQAAENFAQKGLAANPPAEDNEKLLYLLALAHHNKGDHASAADILEKLLANSSNSSAHYSLGILYTYYLNKAKEGKEEFEKALKAPGLSPALKKSISEELEKATQENK